MADSSPAAWEDLADDIRRARATETAEVWQARAHQAEARVAELEDAIERALELLRSDFPQAAATRLEKGLANA